MSAFVAPETVVETNLAKKETQPVRIIAATVKSGRDTTLAGLRAETQP
jgi:hypothetical protein